MFHQTSWKDKITVGEKIDHSLCWCTWQKPSKKFTLREPSALLRQVACAGYLQDDVWVMPIQTASSSEAKEAILQLQRADPMLYSPLRFRRPVHSQCCKSHLTPDSECPSFPAAPSKPAFLQVLRVGSGWLLEGQACLPSWLTQATFTVVSRCQ